MDKTTEYLLNKQSNRPINKIAEKINVIGKLDADDLMIFTLGTYNDRNQWKKAELVEYITKATNAVKKVADKLKNELLEFNNYAFEWDEPTVYLRHGIQLGWMFKAHNTYSKNKTYNKEEKEKILDILKKNITIVY